MTRIALEVRPMIDMLSRMEISLEEMVERRPVEGHPHENSRILQIPVALLTAAERQHSRIEHRTDSTSSSTTTTLGRHEAAIDGNGHPVKGPTDDRKKIPGGKRDGADVDLDRIRAR